MNAEELILFTNKFPYEGGETFLETEIHHLAGAFRQVRICPLEKGEQYYGPLPANVFVVDYSENDHFRIRDAFTGYGMVILGRYIRAFIKSGHRIKYLTQFRYTWNILMGYIRRSVWMMKQFKPEQTGHNRGMVFYSYWFNEWASALAIARTKGLAGRFVVRAHGYDYDELQNGRGYFPFRESDVTQFDKIVHISNYGYNKMQMQYPRLRNLELYRLGVVDHGLNPSPEPNIQFKIISCSNFVKVKQMPLIIEVLSKLKSSFQWIHFGWSAGAEKIVHLAEEKLKPGTFQFKGLVSNAEIMNYYRLNAFDLFINLSSLEGIPVSMMEAISFGIPVTGINTCGVPEIVNDRTGILFEKGMNSSQIANKIDVFLQTKSRDQEFRKGIKAFYSEVFRADLNYSKFVNQILIK